MATIVDAYSPYVVVPKLPTYKKPYTPKQNTDPSAYYTKALGFLPIDVRYMVNTTNNLAYNSMADVLFNKAAQDKRWTNKPWMQGVSNPLRIVADTALLIKDTVVDPIVQGSIEDGWSGFARGGSTALMNTLVNIGNTLDIVSNPVKGLILDGPEGFIKGLYGDEHGRKQYDYNEHINTGDGVANFLLSLVAEIVSDPLNWVSFGGKQAIASGADAVSTSATKSIKEALEAALETSTKTVDDLIPTLKGVTGDISDDAAKSFLQNMADESGNITKAAVSKVDELQPVLKKAITRAEVTGDYSKVANGLAQSKKTRYKASFFDPTAARLTPASQAFVSSYLENATKNMPDLLGRNINRRIAAGVAARNFANKAETILRYTAGATSLDWAIAGWKGSSWAKGWVRNQLAKNDPGVLKTLDDVYSLLGVQQIKSSITAVEEVTGHNIPSEFVNKVQTLKTQYIRLTEQSSWTKKAVPVIMKKQKEFLTQINDLIENFNLEGVEDLSGLIKHLEDNNKLIHNTDVTALTEFLRTADTVFNEDLTNQATVNLYKRTAQHAKWMRKHPQKAGQGAAFDRGQKQLLEWLNKDGARQLEEMAKTADEVDEAIVKLTDNDFVASLRLDVEANVLPAIEYLEDTYSTLARSDAKSFSDIWEEFTKTLKEFDNNPADDFVKNTLVQRYKDVYNAMTNVKALVDTTPVLPLKHNVLATLAENNQYAESVAQMYDELEANFKALRENLTDPKAAEQLLENYDALRSKLTSLNRWGDLSELTISNAEQYFNKFGISYLDSALSGSNWGTFQKSLTESQLKTIREADKIITKLNQDPAFIAADPWVQSLRLYNGTQINSLKEAYAYFNGLDSIPKTQTDVYTEIQNRIKTILSTPQYGGEQTVALLKDTTNLKSLLAQGAYTVSTPIVTPYSLEVLTQAINDLPNYNNIKAITDIVSIEDIKKFKLVWYTVGNRKADIINRMCGITSAREVESIKVTPHLKEAVFSDPELGPLMVYIKDNGLLPEKYVVGVTGDINNTKTTFVNNIKAVARQQMLKSDPQFHRTKELLDVLGKDPTLSTEAAVKAWNDYLDYYGEQSLKELDYYKNNSIDVLTDQPAFKLQEVLDAYIDTIYRYEDGLITEAQFKQTNKLLKDYLNIKFVEPYADDIVEQTGVSLTLASEKLLKMSDADITNLAEFSIKEIKSEAKAPLAFLIKEYKDVNSPLHQVLNNPELLDDTIDGQTIKEMKSLLERTEDYIKLVENVTARLKVEGVDDSYAAAVLDQVVTQLSRKGRVLNGDLDTITQDIINGANVYMRQTLDAPSSAMDNVLGQTVNDFKLKTGLSEDVTKIVNDIEQSLKSGEAHGAVADVNNWTGLLTLSKTSDDPRLVDLWNDLIATADGKRIVVFDIEATDAGAEAAHVFQIAGKVLNADGTVVDGSEFNYIIRPPKGYKPQPPVLEVVAPGGKAPIQWWTDEIVNAVDDTTRGIRAFDSVEDAIDAFTKHCKAQGEVIIAGHNITGYDVNTLFKRARAGSKAQDFLTDVKKFDSLTVMNANTAYQLAPSQATSVQQILKETLQTLRDQGSGLLTNRPWSGADVSTIVQFKRILQDTAPLTESQLKIATDVIGDAENLKGSIQGLYEKTIDQQLGDILTMWRSPAKITGSGRYFIVTQLNVDAVDDVTKSLLDELSTKGLINIAPGTNIMQFMLGGVEHNKVLLNPRKLFSYELEGVFDLNKISEVYKPIGSDGVRIQDMVKLQHWYNKIQNNRWIPKDYVDAVVDDARNFLKQCADTDESPIVRCLHDDADNITTVATAMYVYNRLSQDSPLRQISEFAHFGDTSKKIAELRGVGQYTPILNQIDELTGKPRFIYEGDNVWFPFDKTAETLKYSDSFDAVNQWRVEKHIFNAYDEAHHILLKDVIDNATTARKQLDALPISQRKAVEHGLKNYNAMLDEAHIKHILERPDRVSALASESFARGGMTIFETPAKVKLDDFSSHFIVVQKETADGIYINFLLARKATVEAAEDIDLDLKSIDGIAGVANKDAKEVIQSLIKARELLANNGVKNVYYSHGDLISEDMFDIVYDAAIRAGVSPDELSDMVDLETLLTRGYFQTPRANNSIIGGKSLRQFLENSDDVHYISDPFKQVAYSTQTGIIRMRQDVVFFSNVLLNEHNNIKTADWLKDIPDEELYKLLKKDPDMKLCYMTKAGTLDKTKSGLVVKEFDVVNVASITKAREMGGVFLLPQTELSQIMQAVNEFDLPPIAKIAKAISDVYKVAYLGSLGFIIRNFIDSNFKTYASLDGMVSLPKSVQHFFQTLGYVRKHANIGREYTKTMGRVFSSDLDYDIFYKFCNKFGEADIATKIAAEYPEKLQKRVLSQVNKLSENMSAEVIKAVKPDLIAPEFFSVMDNFINHGPSAGLSKAIINEMPAKSKVATDTAKGVADQVADALNGWNRFLTEKTPARFVYGANDYIEQAARLSMFLQRLELGDNIADANKAIIKAHFDYSDKSIGMLYTEILFPFMSFSYKNLNFWVDMMYKNPMLVGSMENLFRTIFDYQGLFEPDQGAYEAYDYTFDWSKDVTSFESNMPWTYINAARLYHLLNGNIVIDTGKDVKHDAGYGEKNNDLYRVFKLSPSVLDATKMLFTPLNTYSERLLPPGEVLKNAVVNMANGKGNSDLMRLTTLANMLPYSDILMQRVGVNSVDNGIKLKHNNVFQRTKDVGVDQLLLGSLFGAAYVPQKEHVYYYNSDYNILGGFKTNYYAKRYYTDPYNSKYPSYTLTRMAQNRRPRSIYGTSKTSRIYAQQYNSYQYYKRNTADSIIRNRLKDNYYYY